MGARDAETLDFVSRDRLDGKSAYGRACSRRMHAQTHVIRAIASQRKGTPETTTRVCVVPGLCFAGGDPENKNPRVIDSGLCFQRGGEMRRGGTSKTNTRRNYPGHCFGAGGDGENIIPRSICEGIGGAGRESHENMHQHMKQRHYHSRTRLL